MPIVTKTVADFVAAWEANELIISAALKKPGADRVVVVLHRHVSPLWLPEVWDVG